jgi:methylmalonyl-CoA mutase N-terminal domain/subunit
MHGDAPHCEFSNEISANRCRRSACFLYAFASLQPIINREWGLAKNENPHAGDVQQKIELIRSTEEEKQSQLKRLREFKARHQDESGAMLLRLQQAVITNQNAFEVLVDAVRCCSLGQITNALFEVGGQYRRSM